MQKTDEGEAESIILLVFVLWWCFNYWWGMGGGCCRKSYIGPTRIPSFFNWDFSWSNKYDKFWCAVSTEYFYILLLWAIAVTDFCPLEIYKNLVLPLSTITFTVNSHANNHFYKYICFKYYTVWNHFFYQNACCMCIYINTEYWPEHSFKIFPKRVQIFPIKREALIDKKVRGEGCVEFF